MSVIEVVRHAAVTPAQVFAVIEDGWSFAGWVVGASHIRSVDPDWPAVGSRIHHSVGPWPVSIKDVTEVEAIEKNAMIEMKARAWPVGAARVRLTVAPAGIDGSEIRLEELVEEGPAAMLPRMAQGALLRPRNKESLRRLVDMAAGRRPRAQ